ncbi:hypothetical protein ONS95_012979 [Cadophora gregata]|uniref:uncharacterized protein n=1 Tax=Cadophora gregata TaxID=51156 RepID=UPI0026DD11E1|nr:uncharacterized protein ONS95_012979 [Cadophora gregata]KAK0115937.1 hypothetical protein ONS95_012979 [Cadophora gregata]
MRTDPPEIYGWRIFVLACSGKTENQHNPAVVHELWGGPTAVEVGSCPRTWVVRGSG